MLRLTRGGRPPASSNRLTQRRPPSGAAACEARTGVSCSYEEECDLSLRWGELAGYTERGANADSSPGFRSILSTSAACTSSA